MKTNIINSTQNTNILICDEPGDGGANHEYEIYVTTEPARRLGLVKFQKGPLKESQPNGIMNEDLLVIVINRLRGFQSGKFSCRENALALTKLEEALHWLNHRTQNRIQRGVEGTHQL